MAKNKRGIRRPNSMKPPSTKTTKRVPTNRGIHTYVKPRIDNRFGKGRRNPFENAMDLPEIMTVPWEAFDLTVRQTKMVRT